MLPLRYSPFSLAAGTLIDIGLPPFATSQVFIGTTGNDTFTGTQLSDRFDMSQGGQDMVLGARGDDVFEFGARFSAHDRIDGGKGFDTLELNGDYSGPETIRMASPMLSRVEAIHLAGGHAYSFYIDALGMTSKMLTIDGSELGQTKMLYVYAGNIGRGDFTLIGGAHGDDLIGGGGRDVFTGGRGADNLEGNGGHDLFVYLSVSDSTGVAFDSVGFNPRQDLFSMPNEVSGVDRVVHGGPLNGSDDRTFNAGLEAAIGGDELAAGHAVVYRPGSGQWGGHDFLVVDANGQAGYQGGEDFVIQIGGTRGQFISLDNFVT